MSLSPAMQRSLARLGLLVLGVSALGWYHTSKTVGSDYRWHHEFAVPAAPNDTLDVQFRFPQTGNAPAATGALSRSVNFFQITYGGAANNADIVVWSRAFVSAGPTTSVDTVRVMANARTFVISGARVDSCRFINGTATDRIYIDGAG